jgi:hypothetical protein
MDRELVVQVRPLRRQKRGMYVTACGRYIILRDPSVSKSAAGWFIYPSPGKHEGVDCAYPVFLKGARGWSTRARAVRVLETSKTIDLEPSE